MASNGATSFVFLIYGDIQWGSGAQIGFNAGDGIKSFMVPGARSSSTLNMETMSNVGKPGLFIYRVSGLQIEGIGSLGRLMISSINFVILILMDAFHHRIFKFTICYDVTVY